VWTEQYDRVIERIFEVQSGIARAIVSAIRVELTPDEEARLAGARPVDPDAYRAYLLGRYHFGKQRPEDFRKAREYFEQAIAIDPEFASAYAALAGATQIMGLWKMLPPTAIESSRRYTLEALTRGEDLSEAHVASAFLSLWDRDPAAAEAHHRRAIELGPSSPEAHSSYALYLMGVARRPRQALNVARKAFELDPFDGRCIMALCWALGGSGRHDEATTLVQEWLVMEPNHPVATRMLAHGYAVQGKYDEALEYFERMWRVSAGTEEQRKQYRHLVSTSGFAGVMESVARSLESGSGPDYYRSFNTASFYALAGLYDDALRWLDRAYEAHNPDLMHVNAYPAFNPLHSDPRFQDLLRRMNYPVD
jgi:pentatricopeptide repeat protein